MLPYYTQRYRSSYQGTHRKKCAARAYRPDDRLRINAAVSVEEHTSVYRHKTTHFVVDYVDGQMDILIVVFELIDLYPERMITVKYFIFG